MNRIHYTRIFFASFFCLFIPLLVRSQVSPNKNYPKHYFQWPVGTKVGIVANFGELRPNHYHMGLDCRTDGRVNLPIYAAAEGYISKIHIDPTGFGRAIYINHTNGLTTLYAHLNQFFPALEAYLIEQQYKIKSWKIDIDLPADLFKVYKGDFIAYSGNTGGSQGPHLHFEIRDTKTDKVLNPLLFGFPIEDNIPPDIMRLSVYNRRYNTYEQSPILFSIKKNNGVFQPTSRLLKINADNISFAISAFDRYTGSTNQNGVYSAEVFKDDEPIVSFEMDSISYDETRYLNAHIDYKTRNTGGPFLQHLSMLPGYTNGIYKMSNGNDGVIDLTDNNIHHIKIIVKDANQNTSVLLFDVIKGSEGFSVKADNKKMGEIFKPGHINVYENESFQMYLPEKCIYDSFHFFMNQSSTYNNGNIYSVNNENIPIQKYFPIRIKGNYRIKDTGKIVMKLTAHGKDKFKKANYKNGWYESYFRDFGKYQLLLDSIPPTLNPIGSFKENAQISGSSAIMFSATDNAKDIDEFTGWLDGQWLLFSNDKNGAYIYKPDKYCTPGEHYLQIIVRDIVGNTTIKNYHFTKR